MNLKTIEYFLTIADELNITKAADRICISQQALSGQLKRLEDELQTPLFYRKPTLRLTAAGKQLQYYGMQLIRTETNFKTALMDLGLNTSASLRFGISRLRSEAFFPLIWKFYHGSHPNIDIELINGSSADFEKMLENGKLDLYLGVDPPVGYNRHIVPLQSEKIWCGIPVGLLKKYYPDNWENLLGNFEKNGVDPKLIAKMPFLGMRQGNHLRWSVDEYMSGYGVLHYTLETDEQEILYQAARAGSGVCIISPVVLYRHHRDADFGDDSLRTFPMTKAMYESKTFLVYSTLYPLPTYMQDFIRDVTQIFQSYAHSTDKGFL
ncbi:MAG: LysR family transcriptional regulator [Bacillota bacterium]|nr:LysR family transcriptional regulator [Bacillota bacterium]